MTTRISVRDTSHDEQRPPPDPLPSRLRWIVGALLAVTLALFAPAAASAQSSELDSSAYVGTWSGQNRQMTLNSDGTGYLTVSRGQQGGEAWSLTWSALPSSIVIELQTRAMVEGNGLGGTLGSGTWWYGTLQSSGGTTVLRLGDSLGTSGIGTYWCNQQMYGFSSVCES